MINAKTRYHDVKIFQATSFLASGRFVKNESNLRNFHFVSAYHEVSISEVFSEIAVLHKVSKFFSKTAK